MIGPRGETVVPADVIAAAQREARIEAPDLVRQRVLARLRQTVLAETALPLPAEASGRAGEIGAAKESGAATSGVAAVSTARVLTGWAAKGAVLLALAGGGAGLHAWLRPGHAPSPSAEAHVAKMPQLTIGLEEPAPTGRHAVQGSAAIAANAERGAESAPMQVVAAPSPADVRPTSAGIAGRTAEGGPKRRSVASGLAAERALLDDARRALARGDAAAALRPLARHASSFSRGQLIEERESMWVKALVLSGRRSEGEARAASFRRRFPESLFLPMVDAALRAPRR